MSTRDLCPCPKHGGPCGHPASISLGEAPYCVDCACWCLPACEGCGAAFEPREGETTCPDCPEEPDGNIAGAGRERCETMLPQSDGRVFQCCKALRHDGWHMSDWHEVFAKGERRMLKRIERSGVRS